MEISKEDRKELLAKLGFIVPAVGDLATGSTCSCCGATRGRKNERTRYTDGYAFVFTICDADQLVSIPEREDRGVLAIPDNELNLLIDWHKK